MIKRTKGLTINSFRIVETDKSTISAFHMLSMDGIEYSGFFMEPAGPETEMSGLRKRIPSGTYGITKHDGASYHNVPKLYLRSEGTMGSFAQRAILMHSGSLPSNTEGCLLPGNSFTTNFIKNSYKTLNIIKDQLKKYDWQNSIINIIDVLPLQK